MSELYFKNKYSENTDVKIIIHQNFIDSPDLLLQEILEYPFYVPTCILADLQVNPKRKICVFSDPGLSLNFNLHTAVGREWTPAMQDIKEKLKMLCNAPLNFSILTHLKHGSRYMDYSQGYAQNHFICFGAPRTLQLKGPTFENEDIPLNVGDCITIFTPQNVTFSWSVRKEEELLASSILMHLFHVPENLPPKRKLVETFPYNDWMEKYMLQLEPIPEKTFELSAFLLLHIQQLQTRFIINLRRYDVAGNSKIPTTKGIIFSTSDWWCFEERVSRFYLQYVRTSTVVNNSILLLHRNSNLYLQRLFKDHQYDVILQRTYVELDEGELETLKNKLYDITEALISSYWGKFIPLMFRRKFHSLKINLQVVEHQIIQSAFVNILEQQFSPIIKTLFQCEGCKLNSNGQMSHDCITKSMRHQFNTLGPNIWLLVNSELLCQTLCTQNIFPEDFFDTVCITDYHELLFNEEMV